VQPKAPLSLQRKLLFGLSIWLGGGLIGYLSLRLWIVSEKIEAETEQKLEEVNLSIVTVVQTAYTIYQEKVTKNLNVFDAQVQKRMWLAPNNPVEREVENQITGKVERRSLPRMKYLGTFGEEVDVEEEFVDPTTTMIGGTVTLFQLMEDGLLRISTSVIRKDGRRGTGTFIPSDSPVYQSILAGETYLGRAYVVDDWYITAYNPLYDQEGNIIGASYVGVNQQELDSLRRIFQQLSGDNLHSSSLIDVQGNVLISPFHAGENVLEEQQHPFQKEFKQLLNEIHSGVHEGRLILRDENQVMVTRYHYIPEMDWVVISGLDRKIQDRQILLQILPRAVAGIILLIGSLFLIWQLTGRFSRPLKQLTKQLHSMPPGVFQLQLPKSADRETTELTNALQNMGDQIQNFTNELEQKVRDRTKEIEDQNRELVVARKRAEESNRAKSAFLATMSHEIRTPMNAVIGMTSLLETSHLNNQQRDQVVTIRESGDALLDIINDILDFSKIESGHLELEHEVFRVQECLESPLQLVAARAREKNIELTPSLSPTLPRALRGDSGRLRQVLLNLLGNAIKFTNSGQVVLEASSERKEDDLIQLTIKVNDSGVGIPQEKLVTVFDPFTQADSSTARTFGGTGLGLTISKRLIEAMNGSIEVESQVGVGTCFTLKIPFPLAMVPDEEAPPRENLAKSRILVVDDNAVNRRVLKQHLDHWQAESLCAATAQEALDMLQQGEAHFDAILLDYDMPGMDGEELALHISKLEKHKQIPRILISSTGNPNHRELFDAIHDKPIRMQFLYESLCSLLGQQDAGAHRRHEEAQAFPHDFAERHPMQLLVVEDNAVNRKVALQYLSRLGYQADVVCDGSEALKQLEKIPYDLVLMDVQMPIMDGIEATRLLRKLNLEKQPKVVALSASVFLEERESAIRAGMDDFMAKPLRIESLVQMLEKGSARS